MVQALFRGCRAGGKDLCERALFGGVLSSATRRSWGLDVGILEMAFKGEIDDARVAVVQAADDL